MVQPTSVFSGFSVNNLEEAKEFYTKTLGFQVEDNGMGLTIHFPENGSVFIYQKEGHVPATFTILNMVVDHIDEAVSDLKAKGVRFERYQDIPQDEHDIARGISQHRGPDIAWFKDPAGNIISVLQQK